MNPRKITRYCRYLGFWQGMYSYISLVTTKNRLIGVRSRGIKGPIWLRPGTSDNAVFGQVFLNNQYDIKGGYEPALIIDAGANIGLTSLVFARQFPKALILAIEPEESNIAVLRKNIQNYPQIKSIHGAVWYRKERLQISNPAVLHWAFQVNTSADQTSGIQGETIDEIILSSNRQKADIVKLDIEGAEKELFLLGKNDWLGSVSVIMVELHDRLKPGCKSAFESAYNTRDFSVTNTGEITILYRKEG